MLSRDGGPAVNPSGQVKKSIHRYLWLEKYYLKTI